MVITNPSCPLHLLLHFFLLSKNNSSKQLILMMILPLLRYFWFHSIYSLAASCSLQSAVCSLQSAVCKCHTPHLRLFVGSLQKFQQGLFVKSWIIFDSLPTLFREVHVRSRSEVYIFHANYTDLIPEGVVDCSSRIELEQNNVCQCHKLAHESIATG